MIQEKKQVLEAVSFLQAKGFEKPEWSIILGTGLGRLAEDIEVISEVSYEAIPHFPVSTVESHSGKLIYGDLGGKKVVAAQGRFHLYEGYSAKKAVMPVRCFKELGAEKLFVSNAAGALNLAFGKGELMLIEDHINLLPENPLVGENEDSWGARFPDMSEAYHKEYRMKLVELASEFGIKLNKGVYVSVAGPNLETAAEYRFLHKIGADAVGMSTVHEVITAHHMNMKVLAISALTDECDPNNLEEVALADILKEAAKAEQQLVKLVEAFIERH